MKTLKIFKPAFVALFLILAVETLQLLTDANYYPYLSTPYETLASIALGLVSLSIILAGLAALASLITSRLCVKESYPVALADILSVTALGLVYIPALIFLIKTNYPESVNLYWHTAYGVYPIATLVVITVIRLFLRKIFNRVFYNIVDLLFKPAAALTIISAVFVAIFFITADRAGPQIANSKAQSKSERPNVFLITFDAMQASDMSLYGYPRKTTPFWEEFARESFVFNNMHSNYHNTQPSLSSILTSKYPWKHGVFNWLDNIKSDRDENLAAQLRGDYYTKAIVPGMYQLPDFLGLKGEFNSTKWASFNAPLPALFNILTSIGLSPYSFPIIRHINFLSNGGTPRAYYDEPFDIAADFLEEKSVDPLFMWVHIWPPHFPYDPPPPFRGSFLPADTEIAPLGGASAVEQRHIIKEMRARYDECILFTDNALSGFIRKLKLLGIYKNSIIIVSSDHGNIFDKDDTIMNASLMEESIFHIPLLIHLPGQKTGVRVESLAEHVDIGPTILDLLGRPVPKWMDGETLLPYMREPGLRSNKTKFSMSFVYGEGSDDVRWFSAYKGDYKFVYDLDTDKGFLFRTNEAHSNESDLSREKRAIYRELRGKVIKKIDENFDIINRKRAGGDR